MSKEMICIMCPRGCHLKVSKDLVVSGNVCPRGKTYAMEEVTHPMRILTTTMKTTYKKYPRISIKSQKAIPKELIFKAMDEINHHTLDKHVHIGDIVIKDICHTGIDMIATKNI